MDLKLIKGKRYLCKKTVIMNPPLREEAFTEGEVYTADSEISLVDNQNVAHIIISDLTDSDFYVEHFTILPENVKISPFMRGVVTSLPIELEEPKYPRVMEVSLYEDFRVSFKRVVFMKKLNVFLFWTDCETFEEAENCLSISQTLYAREVQPITVSRQEIADWKGCNVDDILIID